MDNKEFEEKLEKEIKTFKEVPISVDEKIQKAFIKIEENERAEKELNKGRKNKFNYSRVLGLAASFVMAIFLAGNGVAYAKGEPNIYSWVLEKIGIQKEYEEVKTEINQTVESNGVEITLEDIGYDDNFLIAGYKIEKTNICDEIYNYIVDVNRDNNKEKKEIIEDILGLAYQIKVSDNTQEIYFGNYTDVEKNIIQDEEKINVDIETYKLVNIISNNEIIVYYIHDMSEYNFEEKIDIDVFISEVQVEFYMEADPPVFEGEWRYNIDDLVKGTVEFKNFYTENSKVNFEVEKEYGWYYGEDGVTKEYSTTPMITLKSGEVGEITIDSIQISKIGTILSLKTNMEIPTAVDASIDMPWYAIDIIDSEGNIILDKEQVVDGASYFMERLNAKEEYTLRVFKYYSSYVEEFNSELEFEYVTSNKFNIYENN